MVAGDVHVGTEGQNLVVNHSNTLTDHEGRISRLEEDRTDQWSAINALRNRLPVWATLGLGMVMAYAGWTTAMAFRN